VVRELWTSFLMQTTAYHEDTKYFEEREENYRRVFLRALRTLHDFVRSRTMLCGLGLVLLMTAAARAETIDRVLAVVAGQIITLTDVTAARDLRLETTDGAADPIRALLSKLIDRELILAEVERYAPAEPTAEEVEREMARVRARFVSPEELADALRRSGIDATHLRETLRQNLRIRAYMEQRFAATADRRQELVDQWLAGLRRRADVIDSYLARR
jgi:hypothetical protein